MKAPILTLVIIWLTKCNILSAFDLNVIHINDFHARFEETNDAGGSCKDDQCIGGFSRMYSVITSALADQPDTLLLNGGDNFQGTLWYNLFKWNVTQYFLNKLPWDAIVLGNHEFDDGIAGVVPFITNLIAPVVVSNINDTLEPDIQGTYQKSVVVEKNGKRIGIIGVILQKTYELSTTEDLSFFDESTSVNAEAERLVREENVFTNIVLSHSGYDLEQEIAKKTTAASKISLIVGAHSHSFLYTGDIVPGPLTPIGPYPTIVPRDEDSKNVLVVQAASYCRYVGNITVSYDDNGEYIGWAGAPIFLETTIPQDETINQEMQPWKDIVDATGNRVIGTTVVTLDQSMCRYSECLLGNLVTDAMVYSFIDQADNSSWTYASLAVYNAGGLRTTIPYGDITYNDMITAQPFGNGWDVGEIEGRYIKEMFEFMLTPYNYFSRAAVDVNLLQISGFQVVANLSQPIGSRVESLQVRCNECRIPIYEDLDEAKIYRLIVPTFLESGGDGFVVISDNLKNIQPGKTDIDVLVDYLGHKSPIFQEIGARIDFVGETELQHRSWDY